MAEFHRLLATLKSALQTRREGEGPPAANTSDPVPVTQGAQRAELISRFARELDAVGGHFLGVLSPAETIERTLTLVREMGANSIACGQGIACDLSSIAAALEAAGFSVIRTAAVADGDRAAVRDRVARASLGIAEANFAIAATGTLAVLADDARPQSLTLLPPASLMLVDVGRVRADLAATLAEIGAQAIATHRLSLITGPSRTADIEKRIVLGIHGPRALHVAMVWQGEPAR